MMESFNSTLKINNIVTAKRNKDMEQSPFCRREN
jgi:hypothetical protein